MARLEAANEKINQLDLSDNYKLKINDSIEIMEKMEMQNKSPSPANRVINLTSINKSQLSPTGKDMIILSDKSMTNI